MLQRPASSSPLEWIQDHLGPIVVGFFVFVLPAIRSALAAKKQREELKQRTLERGAPPPGTEADGKRSWKDLLEGRTAEPQAPAAPPPLPPRSRIPPQRLEPEAAEEESLEDNPPPVLVELPSKDARDPEPETSAEELVVARERAEEARQTAVAEAEYEAASPYRAEVGPQAASAVPDVQPLVPVRPGGASRWLFPTEPARDRRAALRRAMVLREVLGPPVGMR